MFELDIFIHLEAVDRTTWTGAPNDRPLAEMGLQQAQRMADYLSQRPIDAIVSSPALRCRESLEPLSKKVGLPIEVVPGFKDTQGYRAPDGWAAPDQAARHPLGGAQSAGSAYRALRSLEGRFPSGRAVLCSYGDIVPALLAFLSGAYEIPVPERNNQWGAIWAITVDGDSVAVATHDPVPGFPHSERDYYPMGPNFS